MGAHTRSKSPGFLAFPFLLIFLLFVDAPGPWGPGHARAQSRATSVVRGTVVTPDSTPLEAAEVTIRQLETGAVQRTSTNDRGRFLFPLLQPGGPYQLDVTLLGYGSQQRDSLYLAVGDITTVDVELRNEAIELAGIEVVADRAEIFNPSQVGQATRITERTLEAMPILSRNVMELAVLSPLVKTTEGGGFSVAGQNDRYNAIMVDGILSKDVFGLTAGGVPGGQAGAKLIPVDAVAQYEVLIAPFDVRLSGFTGGVMNAVTRTGTNEWRVRGAAVHRAEALMGDLSLPTGPVEASGVDRTLFALSVGGPIVRDRGHFFVTAEFEERHQPPTGFNLLRDDASLVRITPTAVQEMEDLFRTRFDLETGRPGPYPLGQQLGNVFGRLDWNFPGGTRLTVRNIFARAENDETPNRFTVNPYELSSNAVFRTSTNNTTSFQLYSQVGDWGNNELDVDIQYTADRTEPASNWPQMEVELRSSVGDVGFRRPVRVGAQFFGQRNDLEQTTFRFKNSLNIHTDLGNNVTLGVTGALYDIHHEYLPGALGEYYYASMTDLKNNAPQRYQRTVLEEWASPAVDFQVLEWGLFAQNQIDAGKGLTMRFGIRLDVPHVLSSPEHNPDIMDVLELDTSKVPGGNFLISPRWGFNWQSSGRLTTQVRGGAGAFAGQLPYVWLSNAFHNDGMRSVNRFCQGRWTDDPVPGTAVPPFEPGNPPSGCWTSDFIERRSVVVFSEDFKYPQDVKFSLAVDQELSESISASLGVMFNKRFNQVGLEEMNIERGPPTHRLGIKSGLGDPGRRYFRRLTKSHAGYVRLLPEYDQALLVTNEGEDWGASINGELRGAITDRLRFQLGYAWAGAWDRRSLVHTDMIANFGLTPNEADINKPSVTSSNFHRPHKFVATLFGAPFPGLPDTEISLLYTGQSGLPFSYVYRFDLNGDGYPGRGAAFDRNNDLMYVPESGSELPAGFTTQALVDQALETDECLAEYKGRIIPRNGCRAPWQNRLDLRLTQNVRLGGAEIRLQGDLINVLNLMSRDWGKVETLSPVVPVMEGCLSCVGGGLGPGEPGVWWGSAVLTARDEEGKIEAADPWNVLSPDSQWQAQFGVQVTFGGNR